MLQFVCMCNAGLQFTSCGPFANGGQVWPEIERFDHKTEMKELLVRVTGMDLYIRRWDGRPVLGGICSGLAVAVFENCFFLTPENLCLFI